MPPFYNFLYRLKINTTPIPPITTSKSKIISEVFDPLSALTIDFEETFTKLKLWLAGVEI